MEVQAITPRGYCKGVVRAIDMARKARNAKQPVVILGMIVHIPVYCGRAGEDGDPHGRSPGQDTTGAPG